MEQASLEADIKKEGDSAVNHLERKGVEAGVLLKSGHDELGFWSTVMRFKKAVFICNLLCIAAAADGYQYTLNGNIIANQGFTNHIGFKNAEGVFTLDAHYTALWGAMQSFGQLVGMLLLNPVSDKIGRKMTLYFIWVLLGVAIAIESTVHSWRDWAVAKLLVGIGIGALQATLPIYITEWSPANIRGAMVVAYGFWNALGKFLAPLLLYLSENSDPLNYKTPILTQWAFLAIMVPIFLWIPETPYYYADHDLDEKGKAAMKRVNGGVPGYDVEMEYAVVKNTIMEERRFRHDFGLVDHTWKQLLMSYVECFRGNNALRTLGAALPGCASQLTGLSFLSTYVSLFFKQSGFANPFLITSILTIIAVVTCILIILFTDRLGRRVMVIVACVVCGSTMLIVGILGQVSKTPPLKDFLIFIACLWSCFNVGLSSIGWAFVGEISSQRLRARTAGIAAGFSVLFGLTFNTSLPVILDVNGANWGYNTAWLFLGTSVVTCVLVYFYVPEPSKRNAAEMDELYEKRVPAWRMKTYVTDVQRFQQQNLKI